MYVRDSSLITLAWEDVLCVEKEMEKTFRRVIIGPFASEYSNEFLQRQFGTQ